MITESQWIVDERKHIGLREIKGAEHEPRLITIFKKMDGFWVKIAIGGAMMKRLGVVCLLDRGERE